MANINSNSLGDWFTWNGRLPRSRFLFRFILFVILYDLLFAEWQFQVNTYKVITFLTVQGYELLMFGGGGLFLILTIGPIAVRRFHDLGKSGYYAWLILIPILNIYYLWLLFVKKGDAVANQFGEVSPSKF